MNIDLEWSNFKLIIKNPSKLRWKELFYCYLLEYTDDIGTFESVVSKDNIVNQTDFETNFKNISNQPIESNFNGKLQTCEISNNGGVQAELTVGTSAVELKVNASPLASRINVTLLNSSNVIIYWGYDNTVTIASGTPIEKSQFAVWSVGPNTSIFLIAGSAGNNTRITESA